MHAGHYVQEHQPRVLFVGYGETDEWAHSGRYDLVLRAAHQFDKFVGQLWNTLQSMPSYQGQTTFILTTDHGCGGGLTAWKNHGTKQEGSKNIWIGVLGPDTQPLGERENAPAVAQSKIAATIAVLLGQDYRGSVPQASKPLPGVLGHSNQ
jgi:bisphosphoglycerate-independent phosphoglycerate mutase (AlkP superfamily)